ncbi:MAG: CAT RNA binding domain-containing protein [Alicyclobacillus shizuokensis]|nr:CAT RNA binding domain-containing protein [Alicyclobacillus shizuokensis]
MSDRATDRGGKRVHGGGQNDKGAHFVIERVLNNNVVVVLSPRDDEYILIGKGLGFGARRGQPIAGDDPRVEKSFALVLPTHRASISGFPFNACCVSSRSPIHWWTPYGRSCRKVTK